MKIHHVEPTELEFVPLTKEIKALPLQKNAIYFFMRENVLASEPGKTVLWAQAENENFAKAMKDGFDNYSHVAILTFPTILPDFVDPDMVVTEEEFIDDWVEEVKAEVFPGKDILGLPF